MDVDARLRAPRGPHADPRLRGDARGCHVGLCQELAAGNERRTPPPIRIAGAGFERPPSFQSTPLVEGISVRGSTIERAPSSRVPGKAARRSDRRAAQGCRAQPAWLASSLYLSTDSLRANGKAHFS